MPPMPAQPLSTEPDGRKIGNPVSLARVYESAPARWHVVESLGRGGSAEVWRVIDAEGREAALKVLRSDLRDRPGAAESLRREHAWLDALAGAPFVASFGVTEFQGSPALALEYLPGGDLVSVIGAHPRHWLPALRTVSAALTALHARGAAHGDLKARNVLFAGDGSARVVDLATVGPLDAPAPRTTAAYRPVGERVTARQADAFALAALTFELLTGRLPYGPAGPTAVGPAPPRVASADAVVTALGSAACDVLADGGRRGLSPLLDVIESVDAG